MAIKYYGHGDESKLYIEMPDGVYDYDIFAHLQMEPSPKNAWKVYLIHTLWHVLPLWWHSNYDRRVFLFDIEDSYDFITYNALVIKNLQ